jgi:hypothetical protein
MTWLVRMMAMSAPAIVVPTDRMSELTPTEDEASVGGTLSRMRVGMAAYPMPTPAPAMHEAIMSCQGSLVMNTAST